MALGGTIKAITAVLLAYSISFSQDLKVTLQNVGEVFNFRIENGKLAYDNPLITDADQIIGLAKPVYKALTGQERLPAIKFVSHQEMKKRISEHECVRDDRGHAEFYSRKKDSLFIKNNDLKYVIHALFHGLGHYSKQDLSKGRGLEGMMHEELASIGLDRAAVEFLKNYIRLDNDPNKKGINLGKIAFSKVTSPLLYVSDQVLNKLKEEKGTFLQAYKIAAKKSNYHKMVNYMKRVPVYHKLKNKKVRSKSYNRF